MQHLDEGTIHAWLDGALPAEESAGVERHVAQCKECASLVAEARGMIAGASRIVSALDVVPGGVIPKSSQAKASSTSLWRALRFTPSRAALAATLVLAVSAVLARRHATLDTMVPTIPPVAAPIPSAASAAAPVNEVRREPQPAELQASAKTDKPTPARKAVADARTQKPDSTPVLAKATRADTADTKVALERQVVAGAPAAPAVVAPPSANAALGGAAANATRALDKVASDSTRALERARRIDSTSAQRAAMARDFSRAEAARPVRAAAPGFAPQGNEAFVGCYELGDIASKDKSLPARFALDIVRADPRANFVRAVAFDGGADSVIAGASWQNLGPSMIAVRIPSGAKQIEMTLSFVTGSSIGVATILGDGSTKTASVTRLTCRR